MVKWNGSDDVFEWLPTRFLFDGRNVWSVNNVFYSYSIRSTVVFQLLPQQRRLQYLGQSVRWPTQIRRLLQRSIKHVHAGCSRFNKKRRTGYADPR
ncbi:hypothetical protein BDFB_004738 [Asbolus verrucosus]|uniref:Uncharacterized protein n=1 Tax=Asbolus verrucosus TaxID=1661398 RepID=A0A482VEM9_ASBVE|nr:hypothetical protein BDFB_004738 [Asbolus verrucosus]